MVKRISDTMKVKGETKMKKIRFLLPLLVVLFFIPKARADQSRFYEEAKDKSNLLVYRNAMAAATVSTAAVLIDLSDTTNWPHKEDESIEIQGIRLQVDKTTSATSTFTVRIGVLNYVDTSSGTVTWFWNHEEGLSVTSNTSVANYVEYPAALNFKVLRGTGTMEGTVPNLKSNLTLNTNIFQTDVMLPSPATGGNTKPGYGDIVALIDKGASAITFTFEIFYNSQRGR